MKCWWLHHKLAQKDNIIRKQIIRSNLYLFKQISDLFHILLVISSILLHHEICSFHFFIIAGGFL